MTEPTRPYSKEDLGELAEALMRAWMKHQARCLSPQGSEELEGLRKTTRYALSTHPQAQELLRRLRTRVAVQKSGTVPQGASFEAPEEEAVKLTAAGRLGGARTSTKRSP